MHRLMLVKNCNQQTIFAFNAIMQSNMYEAVLIYDNRI